MRRTSGELGAALRQWRQPREFRIQPSAWPADARSAFADLAEAIKAPGNGQASPSTGGLEADAIAEMVTNLWRLSRRMRASADGGPRIARRHLDAAWDTLEQAGVEVRDHVDEPFDSGLALRVVAFQPTPGIDRERVIETVRPDVYLHKKMIQMGEVIVGTPEGPADSSQQEGTGSR